MPSVTYVFSPNTVIASAKINQDFSDAIAGSVPIGGVIDYWSDGGASPDNYVFCDGSVISDVGSPLNGKTTPDLRQAFTRGTANANLRTSPVTGGEDTHTLTTTEMPSHSHGVTDPGHTHLVSVNAIFSTGGTNTEAHVRFNGALGQVVGGISNTTGISINNAGSGGSHNNIPVYVGMVKIMRII